MSGPMTGLALFNAIATAGKTLYEVTQGVSNLDTKRQLMDVYDTLMNLKREAAELEDENRSLKAKLRFKSDDFEFKNPFWFEKTHPDRPLCPRCFAQEIAAPMGEPKPGNSFLYCLVCHEAIEFQASRRGFHNFPDLTAWS